ncbi:hypothetical protein AALO_G00057740 [Alosa alosa]|uniref:Uncharacterized protein n=1 Tax=Alosa alosa TaxID=278164 RepID=A0AAV6H9B7_9TELE|nr:hypothetical protein AALO_G00057740 [Alosa alosa]
MFICICLHILLHQNFSETILKCRMLSTFSCNTFLKLNLKLYMTKRNGPAQVTHFFLFLPSVVIASTRGHIMVVAHAARPPQQIPIFNRSLVTGLKTPCRKCYPTTRRISLIMGMMEMWISSPSPVVCRIPITYLVRRRIKDPQNLDRLEEVNELSLKTTRLMKS